MKPLVRFLALLLCLVTMLWGCQRTTTVILPPETSGADGSGQSPAPSSTDPKGSATTEISASSTETTATVPAFTDYTEPTAGASASTSEATTEPTDPPPAESTSAPDTEPSTEPTAAPTDAPATEPVTEPTRHPVYSISGHSIGALEYSLLDAINAQRAAEGLPMLTMDATLCALAAIRSYECVENFSHIRPDGRSAFTVLSDYGYYIWSDLDERIHYGTSGLGAGTIVKGWMYNADFSASILSETYTHIGIGVYTENGLTYITCFFAG